MTRHRNRHRPHSRSHTEVVVVDATRCHRLVLQKRDVGRFVVVSPVACSSAPSRHSDRWTQGACRRTGETVPSPYVFLSFRCCPLLFKMVSPVAQRFFGNSFSIFLCTGRWSMDCCLRPIGQRPNRMWPGWDQRPWPRSVWSGLSRFFNILIRTRAALPIPAAL